MGRRTNQTLLCREHVVLMGDSSTQETMFDIYHLLAGLHRKHDLSGPAGDEEIHHGNSSRKTITINVSPADPTVIVDFYGSGAHGEDNASRNMTVQIPGTVHTTITSLLS